MQSRAQRRQYGEPVERLSLSIRYGQRHTRGLEAELVSVTRSTLHIRSPRVHVPLRSSRVASGCPKWNSQPIPALQAVGACHRLLVAAVVLPSVAGVGPAAERQHVALAMRPQDIERLGEPDLRVGGLSLRVHGRAYDGSELPLACTERVSAPVRRHAGSAIRRTSCLHAAQRPQAFRIAAELQPPESPPEVRGGRIPPPIATSLRPRLRLPEHSSTRRRTTGHICPAQRCGP